MQTLTAGLPSPRWRPEAPDTWTAAQSRLADWTGQHTLWRLNEVRKALGDLTDGHMALECSPPDTVAEVQAEVEGVLEQCMKHLWDAGADLVWGDSWWARIMYIELHHTTQVPSFSVMDGLTDRWGDMVYTRAECDEMPLDMTLGFQVLLGVRHVLRERLDEGFEDLKRAGDDVLKGVQAYFRLAREFKNCDEDLYKPCDLAVTMFIDDIRNQMKQDYLRKGYERIFTSRNQGHVDDKLVHPEFVFLRNHPLQCGMMAYRLQQLRWDFRTHFVIRCREVSFAAHLYNAMALRSCGRMAKWKDMEFLLAEMPGARASFLQGPWPTTMAEASKQFAVLEKKAVEREMLPLPAAQQPFSHHGWIDEEGYEEPEASDKRLADVVASIGEETARAWR